MSRTTGWRGRAWRPHPLPVERAGSAGPGAVSGCEAGPSAAGSSSRLPGGHRPRRGHPPRPVRQSTAGGAYRSDQPRLRRQGAFCPARTTACDRKIAPDASFYFGILSGRGGPGSSLARAAGTSIGTSEPWLSRPDKTARMSKRRFAFLTSIWVARGGPPANGFWPIFLSHCFRIDKNRTSKMASAPRPRVARAPEIASGVDFAAKIAVGPVRQGILARRGLSA